MNEDLPPGHQAHDVRLVQEPVRVDVSWLEEGLDGYYDPDDPDDLPVYRFDVYVRAPNTSVEDDEWDEVDNASYCTRLDTSLPLAAVEAFARMVMDKVHDAASCGSSIKRRCEDLSWTPMKRFDSIIASANADHMQGQTPPAPGNDRAGPRI